MSAAPTGRLRWLTAALVVIVALPGVAGAQLVDDHTPWWLWADRWKGDFAYEEETHATGFVDASTAVRGILVLDHREVEGCTVTWVGKQRNTATIDSRAVAGMDEQNEVARLHGTSSSTAQGSFPLSSRTGLAISMEKGAYRLSVTASPSATVKGSSGTTGAVDMTGFSQQTGWSDSGEVEVGFEQKAYKQIPEARGPLDDSLNETQGASDASYQSELRWALEPEHDIEMWVYRYTNLLENDRMSFIEMHREFLEKLDCDGGLFESAPCRAARAALDNVDRRMAVLADDCRRILEVLLRAECQGFAAGMRRTFSALAFEQAVCSSPAKTCDVIHRHLFDYFDSGPTGDDTVTYRRLPNHLHCLYTEDQFDEVATLGATDWLSKALGD